MGLFRGWSTRTICFRHFWLFLWIRWPQRDFETLSGSCLFTHDSDFSSVEVMLNTCRVKLFIYFFDIWLPFLLLKRTNSSSPFTSTLTSWLDFTSTNGHCLNAFIRSFLLQELYSDHV